MVLGGLLLSCQPHSGEADGYGHFEADDYLIASETGGRLISWIIKAGDSVLSGDTLGVCDTALLHLQKVQAEVKKKGIIIKRQLLQAEERVIQIQIDNLKQEINRFNALLHDKAVGRKTVDDLFHELKVAQARKDAFIPKYAGIRQELNAVDVQVKLLDEQMHQCFILAPAKGTIIENYAHPGDWIVPGKFLARMADLDQMTLKAYLSEDQLGDVKLGDRVTVCIDRSGGSLNEYSGIVFWIADEAEFTPKVIQTRKERVNLVYAVKVRVMNDGRIKIGMPGEMTLIQP